MHGLRPVLARHQNREKYTYPRVPEYARCQFGAGESLNPNTVNGHIWEVTFVQLKDPELVQ